MSNNNENNDAAVGVAAVLACVGFAFAILFALFIFVSLALTIPCLLAWNKPKEFGRFKFYPYNARAYVERGYLGGCLAPIFAWFASTMFNVPLNDEYLVWIVLGGYALGSLGFELFWSDEEANIPPAPAQVPPPQASQQSALPAPQAHVQTEFKFATWDDEEEFQ
jgi:hypothetical protein